MRAQPTPFEQPSDLAVPAAMASAPASRKRRSLSGVYVAMWGTLAIFASGYLAVLLLQPEWARSMTTQEPKKDEASEQAARTTLRIATEVESLRRTVADLQRELTYVKTAASARQEAVVPPPQPQPISAQPAEQPSGMPRPVSAHEAAARKPDAKQELVVLNAKPAEEATTVPSEPVRKPVKTVAIAKSADRTRPAEAARTADVVSLATALETGSLPPVPTPQIAFGPATVTPSSEAGAVILDSGPSLDALRLRWNILHDRHQSALRNLEPRYVTGGVRGAPTYQLLAGPVASSDEAIRICALLNAQSVGCSVGPAFVGNAL